jgi:zinc protease
VPGGRIRIQSENVPAIPLSPLQVDSTTHRLANGLRVVVHEDHAAPIVAVHLMYRVGSRDERPGLTGLAHRLEHLLFEGSENCAKGEFDRLLEGAGGSNNGSTWLDRTNYYEVVPTHGLELALWLERERMGHFLPVLDDAMLELQRGVVINERKQSYENRPYGMADERLHQLLFPDDHPYSWPTIGYMPDLEAITLDDARDFFASYYTPRNAVLVLAGDLTPATGIELAERYFGDLPAGPPLPPAAAPVLRPSTARRAEQLEDRVTFPRIYRAYAVPPYGSPEWVALDILCYALADGESSRLQRALVRESQLAQDVDTYLYPTALAGIFGVVATARSGVAPARLEEAMDRVLSEVLAHPLGEDELEGAVRRARRDQIAGLSTMEDRAEELAYSTTIFGDPDELSAILERYTQATPEDVRAAAARYLAPIAGVTLHVVPRPGEGDDEFADEDDDE